MRSAEKTNNVISFLQDIPTQGNEQICIPTFKTQKVNYNPVYKFKQNSF